MRPKTAVSKVTPVLLILCALCITPDKLRLRTEGVVLGKMTDQTGAEAAAPMLIQPGHRPADEIVQDIESLLKISRRSLPSEEFLRTHHQIAALVDELRSANPDDERLAGLLPERWLSLRLMQAVDHNDDRRAQLNAEIHSVLRMSDNPMLRREALFFETMLKFQEPMDGLRAVSLAEAFAHEWPEDNRVGELFYQAASILDKAMWMRIVSGIVLLAIGALIAVTARKSRKPLRRRWIWAAMLGLLGLAILSSTLVTWPDARQAMAVAAVWVYEIWRSLQGFTGTGRAWLAVAMSIAIALIVVIVRQRFWDTSMPWLSARRLWALGLVASLALCCVLDAGLIGFKIADLRNRVVQDYPDSFRGRMVEGQRRQHEQIGKPFELEFTDAISGQRVSTKDLRGKVVVVEFWATWCGPCVREFAEMKRLYTQYHDQGVEFIGVSHDLSEEDGGLEALKAFVAKEQIAWPQFYLGGRNDRAILTGSAMEDFSESWGIDGVPAVFLIDADGNLYSTEAQGKLATLIPRLLHAPKNSALSLRRK